MDNGALSSNGIWQTADIDVYQMTQLNNSTFSTSFVRSFMADHWFNFYFILIKRKAIIMLPWNKIITPIMDKIRNSCHFITKTRELPIVGYGTDSKKCKLAF